jgi:hypothetical protein
VLTIKAKNIDDRLPGRRCRRSGSAHHQRKKRQWCPPWEAALKVWERPPSTLKTSAAGPLGAVLEIRERTPSTLKSINGGPLGDAEGDP